MYISILYKSILLYLYVLFLYQIMDKKELDKLSISDVILTILISEFAIYSITNHNISFFTSILILVTLGIFQLFLNYFSKKNNYLKNDLDGTHTVIIKNGKLIFSALSKLRYTLDDIVNQLKESGVKSVEEVKYAVMQNNGKISVLEKEIPYPMPIILDGIIQKETLKQLKKDELWIQKLLHQKNILLDDVFYAFYTSYKTFIITKKDLF